MFGEQRQRFEELSPDLGACSSRDVVPPMTEQDSDENDEKSLKNQAMSNRYASASRDNVPARKMVESGHWLLESTGMGVNWKIEALLFTECKNLWK